MVVDECKAPFMANVFFNIATRASDAKCNTASKDGLSPAQESLFSLVDVEKFGGFHVL